MAFTLKVQFSGLCLHAVSAKKPESWVLMPDARVNGCLGGDGLTHLDGCDTVPHVGYLTFNLAHLGIPVPQVREPLPGVGAGDGALDAVFRFDQQELDFGLEAEKKQSRDLGEVPDFSDFASKLRLCRDVFGDKVRSPLLFRAKLRGGRLEPADPNALLDMWTLSGRLNTKETLPLLKAAPGALLWTRKVERDALRITIRDFNKKRESYLDLHPIRIGGRNVISLQIANLCANNPLEWNQLNIRGIPAGEDSDFKWFYRLFEPKRGTWKQLLNELFLPAPLLTKLHRTDLYGGGAGNCGSARASIG